MTGFDRVIIKDHIEKIAEATGRPLIYLNSSKMSKEGTALEVLEVLDYPEFGIKMIKQLLKVKHQLHNLVMFGSLESAV